MLSRFQVYSKKRKRWVEKGTENDSEPDNDDLAPLPPPKPKGGAKKPAGDLPAGGRGVSAVFIVCGRV